MRAMRWLSLAVILAVAVDAYSELDDSDIMQNDPDAGSHLESLRMTTRGRGGGGGGGGGGYGEAVVENGRSLLREERKRIKAERRRLKEERRQERWARRRHHKQAGHRNQLAGGGGGVLEDPAGAADGDDLHRAPQHHQVIRKGIPISHSGGSSAASGGSLDASASQPSIETSLSSPVHSGSSVSTDYLTIGPTPDVIDLEWLSANLSSLWSVVRSLSKQQGRPFLHRGGGRGRHHHSGVVHPPNPESCPGGDDPCRSAGGQICGGQGTCSCGHCFCHPGYYGTFCQCDDHSCPVYDGMTCGGPSRGQCRCGGCVCRPGYTGESCNCPTDTLTCISPDSGQICSEKGTCECGRCRCSDGHKGMYCEDTVYAAGVCEKLKSCVMCRAWNRDLPSCAHCQITVTTVESLEPSMTTCVMVNSGCLLQFSYIPQTADAYTVLVPRDMVCPT